MPPFYAATRQLNPLTGDYAMNGATWTRGSPMAECILRLVRTPLGRYLPDPTFGIDLSQCNKALPSCAATLRASILLGVSRYVKRGQIKNVAVKVTQVGAVMQYEIAFIDPRAATNPNTVTGTY